MKYLLKLGLRNIFKQKEINLFNILGLSIALTAVLLLSAWLHFELSYDTFHTKHDRIFRFTVEQKVNGITGKHYARTWQEWKENLQEFYPEIECQTMLRPMERVSISINGRHFLVENSYMADSNLAKVFDFEYIFGSGSDNFEPGSGIIISQSLSEKYFGTSDPVGKSIKIKTRSLTSEVERKVTGVVKDFPQNSHFHIDLFYPYSASERNSGFSDWAYTYVQLHNAEDIQAVLSKEKNFTEQFVPEEERQNIHLHFQPIADIHLQSHKDREIEPGGDSQRIRIAIYIMAAILIISLTNYINLNTGLFQKRLKQSAINHIYGSNYAMTLQTMLIEAVILNIVSAVVSTAAFLLLAVSAHNSQLIAFPPLASIPASLIINIALAFIAVSSLLGSIPALLYRYDVVSILSGNRKKSGISLANKFLMAGQFVLSIALIAGSILVYKQNNFLDGKSFLSEDESIFFMDIEPQALGNRLQAYENELKNIPEILDFTYLMEPPADEFNDAFPIKFPVEKQGESIHICPAGESFNRFYHTQIIAGEDFPEYNDKLKEDHFILNESAVRWFGFENAEEAVGQFIQFDFFIDDVMYKGPIVGVIKDFHIQTLHKPIKPIVFFTKPIWYNTLHLKTEPGQKNIAVQKAQAAWIRIFPEIPFNYTFLDDVYEQAYRKERLYSILLQLFAAIGIAISCIGLLGAIKLSIDSKIKEIGIRKVNGAQSHELLLMFNKEFLVWISGAFVVACPVSFLFMNSWLQNFAYKTTITWWIFAAAGFVAIYLAAITISWQTWKTAKSNPVDALRYE